MSTMVSAEAGTSCDMGSADMVWTEEQEGRASDELEIRPGGTVQLMTPRGPLVGQIRTQTQVYKACIS